MYCVFVVTLWLVFSVSLASNTQASEPTPLTNNPERNGCAEVIVRSNVARVKFESDTATGTNLLAFSLEPFAVLQTINWKSEVQTWGKGAIHFSLDFGGSFRLPESFFNVVHFELNKNGILFVSPNDGARVWDLHGHLVRNLSAPNHSYRSGDLASDGTVYLGDMGGRLYIDSPDSTNSKLVIPLFDDSPVVGVKLSGDEKTLAAWSGNELVVTDTQWKTFARFSLGNLNLAGLNRSMDYHFRKVVFTSDGKTVVAEVMGLGQGQPNFEVPKNSAILAFEGDKVRTLSDRTSQNLRELGGLSVSTITCRGATSDVAVYLAKYRRELRAYVVDILSGEVLDSYSLLHHSRVDNTAIAISSDGRYLVTPSEDGTIGVIDRLNRTMTSVRVSEQKQSIPQVAIGWGAIFLANEQGELLEIPNQVFRGGP